MIEKHRPWERPAAGPAQWHVAGDDAALAAAVRDHPGARVAFRPDPTSDLARAVGLREEHRREEGTEHGGASLELGLDALRVTADDRDLFAVNMVVVGAAPDRTTWFTRTRSMVLTVDGRVAHAGPATGVVVATGQYLRGNDVVPRGHPGDGRAEVQVHAVARGQRAGVRARLPQGVHLPHPEIAQTGGRVVEVEVVGRAPLEVDGVPAPAASTVTVEVLPEAYLIVVP